MFLPIVVDGISAEAASKVGSFFGDVGKATFQRELARSLAHGSIGGLSSLAQGGKFKHGFFAGAFASMAGSGMQASKWGVFQTTVGGTVTAAVVGGTASALGGGKFANGAVTGAYTMLFNHLMHQCEIEGNNKRPNKISQFRDKNIAEQIVEWMEYIEQHSGETIYYEEVVSSTLFQSEIREYKGFVNAKSGVSVLSGRKVKYTIINPATVSPNHSISYVDEIGPLNRLMIRQVPIYNPGQGMQLINLDFLDKQSFFNYKKLIFK